MTDQPPSQPPSEEPEGDTPAALTADDAPTAVSSSGPVPEPAASAAPPPAPEPPTAYAVPPPLPPPPPADDGGSAAARLESAFPPDRPERAVGAAFAGGLALALILKAIAR